MRKKLVLTAIILVAVSLCFMWGRGAEEEAETEAASANFNATGLPIVDEPVLYTVAYSKFANDQSDSQAEKECVLFTEEKTNIKLDFIEIPSSAWDDKVNLLFASNDIPDTFFGKVSIASRLDFLTELGQLIDKYAPNIQNLFKIRPDLENMVTAPDGKIYSVPTGEEADFLKSRNFMYINKEWLNTLNLKMPKTLDDFEKVLKAFKTQDPNGNGKQDEIPFTTYDNATKSQYQFFGAFGLPTDPNYLMVKDGKVIFTPTDERFYECLVWMNKMVNEGLFDPQAFTQTIQEYRGKAGADELIMGSMYDLAIYNAVGRDRMDNYAVVPYQLQGPSGYEAKWRVLPGASPKGGGIRPDHFAISADADMPEALVRWVDFINSSKEIKLLWSYSDRKTGLWDVYPEKDAWHVGMPPDLETPFGIARYTTAAPSAPIFLPYEDNRDYTGNSSVSLIEASAKLRASNEVDEWIPAGIWKPEAQKEMQILFTDIDNYMQTFFTNSVINGITEAQWKNHLNQCEKLRIDEYVDLYQNYYDRIMSK